MTSNASEIVALDEDGLSRDLDALAEILRACVHAGASVGFILPFEIAEGRAFWLEKVAPALHARKRILLVAKVAGEAAGTVQLDLDTFPNQRHRAEVAKLLVHPRFRRSGIARALMERIETCAANAGRRLLTLDTAGEAAEALYASLGYERAGRIPGYARDAIEDRCDATTFMFKALPHREDRP